VLPSTRADDEDPHPARLTAGPNRAYEVATTVSPDIVGTNTSGP
jgi:hypothetical protein